MVRGEDYSNKSKLRDLKSELNNDMNYKQV